MKVTHLVLIVSTLVSSTCMAGENEDLARIRAQPLQQCQRDLTQLRAIHGQMKAMTAEEGQLFLKTIAENIRRAGLQIPPPPAPGSAIHLALEARCGGAVQAQNGYRQ